MKRWNEMIRSKRFSEYFFFCWFSTYVDLFASLPLHAIEIHTIFSQDKKVRMTHQQKSLSMKVWKPLDISAQPGSWLGTIKRSVAKADVFATEWSPAVARSQCTLLSNIRRTTPLYSAGKIARGAAWRWRPTALIVRVYSLPFFYGRPIVWDFWVKDSEPRTP